MLPTQTWWKEISYCVPCDILSRIYVSTNIVHTAFLTESYCQRKTALHGFASRKAVLSTESMRASEIISCHGMILCVMVLYEAL